MQSLREIRELLAARGLTPRHRFGQNFLHDHGKIVELVDAAKLQPGETVLEVGPGTGALTECLLEREVRVIAVEIDRDLADLVRDRFGDRITLVEGDCLAKGRRLSPEVVSALEGSPFKLVANLPYQAASPLMASLLMHHSECSGQWVTIQKEVVDRLVAVPGTKAWGPLTAIVRAFATARRIAILPPGCFWPAPKVTSAMAELQPCPQDARPSDLDGFARFVTKLLSPRRKQIGGVLGHEIAASLGIEPQTRAETLSAEQLLALRA
ncbi:MAG: 16S rRNA (adenine(1518)-N(6)/adenine(1519)-N(6))-dimethyltransferase RsmA, partial [Planctomycetota bacterium]|nr:16S rRNA (adenine(1518)-N(6)/adenine(1519)-N(6))-dimethyltransferase RsmA [Planctomycetota bacterium]